MTAITTNMAPRRLPGRLAALNRERFATSELDERCMAVGSRANGFDDEGGYC